MTPLVQQYRVTEYNELNNGEVSDIGVQIMKINLILLRDTNESDLNLVIE